MVFFYFLNVFVLFLNVVFLLLLKQKTYKITNMMHFSWAKTLFPGQSECFPVLLTIFDSFFKVKKTCFYAFFICKLMFLTSMVSFIT